jgi:hypothetical protein
MVALIHRAIYSERGYTRGMGSPFLQIKFSVLAVAEQHKEQLLQQCVECALSAIRGSSEKDTRLAQAILLQLGLDGARALLERFRQLSEQCKEDDSEYLYCKFLLRYHLRSLSVEEFIQLTREYFSPCKLSDEPVTAQIQLRLLEIALLKRSEVGVLHGLRSMAPNLLSQAAVSEDPRVRLLAVKLATNYLTHAQALRLLEQLAEDPDQAVRERVHRDMEAMRASVYRL